MKLYKDGQLVGEFSTTELKELAGVDIEKAAEVAAEAVEVKSFEVGDKVEVIGVSVSGRGEFIGETAVITDILDDRYFQIDERGCSIYPQSSLKLIEEETKEVLSKDNVKVGEYFVVTNTASGHKFKIGEVVKSLDTLNDDCFSAERIGDSYWWWADVLYTNVRRATAEEIAEATKPKFEIGDAISVNGRFALILSELDSEHEYKIKWYSDGGQTYAGKSYIRHATEEEKSHLQTLIGREKDEYKVGDLVELLNGSYSGYEGREGYIFEIDGKFGPRMHLKNNGNRANYKDTHAYPERLKLVTPVEWRHDFVKEVK